MAEEQGTHIVYRGKHYLIPGPLLGPDEAKLRLTNLLSTDAPKMSAMPADLAQPSEKAEPFEEKYPDPMANERILPKIVEAGAMLYGAGALGEGAAVAGAAWKAASAGARITQVLNGLKTIAVEGGKGYLADKAMEGVGVPPNTRYAILAGLGVTRPGATLRKGLRQVFKPAAAATEAAAAEGTPLARNLAKQFGSKENAQAWLDTLNPEQQAAVARQTGIEVPAAAKAAVRPIPQPAAAAPAPASVSSEPAGSELEGQLRASLTTKPKAAPAMDAAVEETKAKAAEIEGKILDWKTKNGWSGAQIESALRNVYGIPPRDGRQMINLVLTANGVQ